MTTLIYRDERTDLEEEVDISWKINEKRGLVTHAGLGLLCLSVGGGSDVCKAQGEWVARTVQKNIVFVGTVCYSMCSAMCCLWGL